MTLRLWPYFVRQAFQNILDNRMVHLIGMGTMIISLLIFGTFLLLYANLNMWIKGWGDSVSMSVYLKDSINEGQKDHITTYLTNIPSAEIKRFISKEGALKDLRNALGSQSGLLEGLSENPLPASFEAEFKNMGKPETHPGQIKKDLEGLEGVEEVHYSEPSAANFEEFMNTVKLIGFVLGGLLCMGVLFIVTNTIKLAIYARKEEIEIMKLVGATDWFVKAPFMLEGMIQGIFSGVIALGVLFGGYALIYSEKASFFGIATLDLTFLPFEYILSLILISIVLGFIGSFVSLGRFFDL